MADVFDDGQWYFLQLVLKVTVLFFLFESVTGSNDCQGNPPKELIATTYAKQLTFPSYSDKYANDLMCHWLIRSSNMSERVMIEVVELSIEDDDDCMYDYLRIYDGRSPLSRTIGTYCGNSKARVNSSGAALFMRFFSDSSVTYKGFTIKYYSFTKNMLNSLEKDGSSGKSKTSHTMVIIGGIIGGVLCSLLLLAFVCVCATTKKCQCCRKPRRTVHPNSANSGFQNMRSHPEHEGSSTPPSDDIPLHALPVYTISPSVPPPYLDSYCHPPEEPYPAHVISGYSAYRLPSSPPPPYSLTDPHAHLYTVPNCISSHTPLHRH